MNKNFLKSITLGIVGLSLATSCSLFKKESHKCKSNSCSSKKDEASKCSAAKAESKAVSKVKKAKRHHKSEIK